MNTNTVTPFLQDEQKSNHKFQSSVIKSKPAGKPAQKSKPAAKPALKTKSAGIPPLKSIPATAVIKKVKEVRKED